MERKLNNLLETLATTLSESDVIAAEQLAKISATLAVSRLQRGMNQKEFAEFMGVSQGMVSKWESEDYNFTVETLAKICAKLQLDLDISLKPQRTIFSSNYTKQKEWKGTPKVLTNSLTNSFGNGAA